MAKKKFPFLFKSAAAAAATSAAVSWPWPSCTNTPKTHSFRANTNEHNKNTYPEQESFSFESETEEFAVIRGLKSERLIFEPGETNFILEEAKTETPYKALEINSQDPFIDFRVSMEEMVEAHGLKEWKFLEELLAWYLRANCKSNHGYIVAAFVDLVINLALGSGSGLVSVSGSSSSTATLYSFSSPPSFCSSSSFSSLCNGLFSGV